MCRAGREPTRVFAIILALTISFISCTSDSDDDDSDSVGEDDFDFDDDADDDGGDNDGAVDDDDDTGNDDVDDDLDDDVDIDIEGSWEEDTWPDAETGLTWQTTNIGPALGWEDAKSLCEALELGGFDDWRLPGISELRTIIRGCAETETGGDCLVTDECHVSDCDSGDTCDGDDIMEGPTQGCYWPSELSGRCTWYWSDTALTEDGWFTWYVSFSNAEIAAEMWDNVYLYVRCVRG
ncbi:MAG: DUF1566 domain-containing protein [Deltaproteobacteria bacterium]|nr:DUF1566 domain-containing protein [Deltaproteobacteria bacterium]